MSCTRGIHCVNWGKHRASPLAHKHNVKNFFNSTTGYLLIKWRCALKCNSWGVLSSTGHHYQPASDLSHHFIRMQGCILIICRWVEMTKSIKVNCLFMHFFLYSWVTKTLRCWTSCHWHYWSFRLKHIVITVTAGPVICKDFSLILKKNQEEN